jgi:hypothetical protein
MGGENQSLYTPYRTLFCHRSPSREDTTRFVPHDLGDLALSARPRPDLDPASTHHRTAGRKGRCGIGLRVFSPSHPLRHHGVQGWPTIPGTRRYSHLHRDRQNFTSRHPGVPASSYNIKGQAKALQGGAKNERIRQDASQKPRSNEQRHTTHKSTSQAISLYSHFSFET